MKFVDLNLRVPIGKNQKRVAEELVKRAAELGYSCIAVPIPIEATQEEIQDLEKMSNNNDLDLIKRLDLRPKSGRELFRSLSVWRRKREVTAVYCDSKSIARYAARDHRVDLISFSSPDPKRRFFDSASAELASNASAALGVDMAPLLISSGFLKVRLMSSLRKEVSIAKKFHVPIVISSGTGDTYLLRRPHDLACLACLFDLDHQTAIRALSEAPSKIVERNREKLSPNYVAPGVFIVRRGENCQDV